MSEVVTDALASAATHPAVWHFISNYWWLFTPMIFGGASLALRLLCCTLCCFQFSMRCKLYTLIAVVFLFVIITLATLVGVALFPHLEGG